VTDYEALARRVGNSWAIHVANVRPTQARRLGEIEEMARDLVACMTKSTCTRSASTSPSNCRLACVIPLSTRTGRERPRSNVEQRPTAIFGRRHSNCARVVSQFARSACCSEFHTKERISY